MIITRTAAAVLWVPIEKLSNIQKLKIVYANLTQIEFSKNLDKNFNNFGCIAGEVIHDVQELQEMVTEKERRIIELEQALGETAKITVAREAALDQHHLVTNHAQHKVTLF